MAKVNKKMKKAANGVKQPKPKDLTYKNLRMGVNAENEAVTGVRKDVRPTSRDSAIYRRGYNLGLEGKKEYPNERSVEKMGRWEGQNVRKAATSKKKMANGGPIGDPIKGKLKSDLGTRSYSVDTSGYAAGKKKFPATVSYGKGKSAPVKMGRVAVSRMMSPGGRKRSSSSK